MNKKEQAQKARLIKISEHGLNERYENCDIVYSEIKYLLRETAEIVNNWANGKESAEKARDKAIVLSEIIANTEDRLFALGKMVRTLERGLDKMGDTK